MSDQYGLNQKRNSSCKSFLTYGLATIFFFLVAPLSGHALDEFAEVAKITGPESCAECHQSTYKVWEGTHQNLIS